MAALLVVACGDDIAGTSNDVGEVGGDLSDGDDLSGDDDVNTEVLGGIAMPGIAEWTAVHHVQVIDSASRVEIWARNERWELIGRIIVEGDGTRLRVSSEYADGGFEVEVIADAGFESYELVYQSLGDDELRTRAAAIEGLLYEGSGPRGKWLACGVFATSVVPACLGPWAAFACIPATVVAGCKCTKAALDLPDDKAGVCENI